MLPDQFELPLVAILRGLPPEEAARVGAILFDAGFRLLEVPLNRPGALASIAALAACAPADAVIGGGTMLSVRDVDDVAAAGGRLFVAPNTDSAVIAHARRCAMLCAPGVATPSEAFAALAAGAHALKIFPASQVGQAGLKAFASVLPPATPLWPVGGIDAGDLAAWRAAGATGFGLGASLYAPRMALTLLASRAAAFAAAMRATRTAP